MDSQLDIERQRWIDKNLSIAATSLQETENALESISIEGFGIPNEIWNNFGAIKEWCKENGGTVLNKR